MRRLALPGLTAALLLLIFIPASAHAAVWKIQETPQAIGEEGESKRLRSVSCPSATQCVAVAGSWADKWNGTKWEYMAVAKSPEGIPRLKSISCPAVNYCIAVGEYVNSSYATKTHAQRWNGTEWKALTTINPEAKTTLSATLRGVSCTATNACTAVGWYENSLGMTVTLVERWNGTEWKVQTSANSKAPETSTSLHAVSCTTATACQAVGETHSNATGSVIFSESWNGTTWAIQPVPNVWGILGDVSCTAANACTAVQARFFGEKVFRWNGVEWKEQTLEIPAGVVNAQPLGVSCTSATSCTLVGSYEIKVGEKYEGRPLAENWNGTKWSFVTTEAPVSSGTLFDVACRSSIECTAVGVYFKPEGIERERALIERYQ